MSSKQKKQPKNAKKVPKKTWVKKSNNPAAEIARKEGQRGVDSRSQAASADTRERTLVSVATDVSIDALGSFDAASIQSLAFGPVLMAIKKGWLSQLTDAVTNTRLAYPFYAYVKLYQSFISAMNGTVPALQSAPRWYWNICQALTSKIVNFKTGRVTLSWDVGEGLQNTVPSADFLYAGGTATLRVPDFGAGFVDGFIPLTDLSVFPYTDDGGAAAISSLFKFYSPEGMTEIVPSYPTPSNTTGSAFAVCGAEIGSSAGNGGGVISTIYSEVPIQMPLYSKFAIYQPVNYRGWQRIQTSGGSPCYVIPRMIELDDERGLYNQLCPQFKYFNFDEFYEVLSLAVGTALEINAKTQVGAPIGVCPLTAQQTKLLLRHTLMKKFYNHFAQDLILNGPGTIGLSPFSCSTNGSSQSETGMLLPLFLAENIRAAGRKKIKLPRQKDYSMIDYVPILARPSQLPEPAQYLWDNGSGLVDLYTVNPSETPINVIDLSYVDGGATKYITTEGNTIVVLTTLWNTWIKELSSFMTQLVDPGAEDGLSAFSLVLTTGHHRFVPAVPPPPEVVNARLLKKDSKKKFKGIDIDTIKQKMKVVPSSVGATGANYFSELYPTYLTTTNIPSDPIVKYTKLMITPMIIADGAQELESATVSAQQLFRIEPYRLPYSNLPTISGAQTTQSNDALSKHLQMAILDTKSSLAAVSEMEQDLMEAAKQGRGGFFSNIAGMFAEDVLGIKGGKAIAGAVGNAFGI